MNQYEQLCKIGEGTHGCVFKVKDKSNNIFAIKRIPATALRQISLLKSVGPHPNIIKLFQVNYEPIDCNLEIVFQFCDCDLKRFVKENKYNLSQETMKKIMRQILLGLSILHQKKVVHRDIKPQNIMLDAQKNAKIADFGLARYITSKQKTLTREVQTLCYRAPEVMLGMKQYGYGIDIWAVGCVFAQFYLKRPLFLGGEYEIQQLLKVFQIMGTPTKQEWPLIENLPDYSIKFPKWKKKPLQSILKNIPPLALDLLQKFLCYDPNRRITCTDALLHPYLL